ncbi:MAG: hypothetical protein J6C23_09190 [Clostridia bacterium]|nr:hypothetical protein [Clostridia bacterium]
MVINIILVVLIIIETVVMVPILIKTYVNPLYEEVPNNIIKYPKIYCFIGCLCLYVCGVGTLVCALFPKGEWWEPIVGLYTAGSPGTLVLPIILILLESKYKIIVYDDRAEYYNILGIKKVFDFEHYSVSSYGVGFRIISKKRKSNGEIKTKRHLQITGFMFNSDSLYVKYKEYKQNHRKGKAAKTKSE